MNKTNPPASSATFSIQRNGDGSKLVSLLALAAGAVAMPQTSNADIIFTDLSGSPAHVGANSDPSFLISNLSGIAQIAFLFHARNTLVTSSRWVVVQENAGYVRLATTSNFFAKPIDKSVTWNQINPLHLFLSGTVGFANDAGNHAPNSY